MSKNLFGNLPLNKAYKSLVYISGFIIILSVFVPTQFPKLMVFSFAGLFCLYGFSLWQVDDVSNKILSYHTDYSERQYSFINAKYKTLGIHCIFGLLLISLILFFTGILPPF